MEKPDNHIVFNGRKLPIKHARLTYGEAVNLRHLDPAIGITHYQQSMRFTDGDLDPDDDFHIRNGTYKLTFSVFTTNGENTREFAGGSFLPVHPQDILGDKAPLDESFYTYFILRVDDNRNGIFDANETWYDGVDGKIQIAGYGDKFIVLIDTEDPSRNMSLKGSYDGAFEVIP